MLYNGNPFIPGHDYMYNLDWLVKKVLKHEHELSLIDQKIKDAVKGELSDERVTRIIEAIISEIQGVVNVKVPPDEIPPAVGDGSKDDTAAIQGCINYVQKYGGVVYFPYGRYLTGPLTVSGKVALFGNDRYSTVLVLNGGAKEPLISGTLDTFSVFGLGFDGNADIQVNNLDNMVINVNSAIIENAYFTDGYTLLDLTVNQDIQLNALIFRDAVENVITSKGNGRIQANNIFMGALSTLRGTSFWINSCNNSIVEQLYLRGYAKIGVNNSGSNCIFRFWNENATADYSTTGANCTYEVYTKKRKETFSGDISTESSNITAKAWGDTTITSGDVDVTATGNIMLTSEDLTLNPTEPLTYQTPITSNKPYNYITMKAKNGDKYKVLVENQYSYRLGQDEILRTSEPINVLTLGVKNDGSEDCSTIVNTASKKYALFFPAGVYRVEHPLEIYQPIFGVPKATEWFDTNCTVLRSYITGDNTVGVVTIPEDAYSVWVQGFLIRCNSSECGLADLGKNTTYLRDLTIYNVGENAYGIWSHHPGTRSLKMNNIFIESVAQWYENTGLKITRGTDIQITDLGIFGFRTQIAMGGALVWMANAHIWGGGDNTLTTASAWSLSVGIDTGPLGRLFATNLYVDTCYTMFKTSNTSTVSVFNLISWNDNESATTISVYNGRMFSSPCESNIVGGTIYGGNRMGRLFENYVNTTNLKIIMFQGMNTLLTGYEWMLPTLGYSSQKTIHYMIRSVANKYFEICRIYSPFGYNKIELSNSANASCILECMGTTYRKTAGSTDMPLYYQVINNWTVFYTTTTSTNASMTMTLLDSSFQGPVDYSSLYDTTMQAFANYSIQDTAAGLTEIPVYYQQVRVSEWTTVQDNLKSHQQSINTINGQISTINNTLSSLDARVKALEAKP